MKRLTGLKMPCVWLPRSVIYAGLLTVTALAACTRPPVRVAVSELASPLDTIIRVALAPAAMTARISSTSLLTVVDGATGMLLATSSAGEQWMARPFGADGIELTRPNTSAVVTRESALVLRADARSGMVSHNGRTYRGSIVVWREGDRLLVANHLPVEEYLLGVVPLEIGVRRNDERAAVAAQAVSARSYTYARLATRRRDSTRRFDLAADVGDQAYGGVAAEVEIATQQVRATRGLVVKYRGRIVEAVYSAACGGVTADAAEVWPFGGQPYLRSVSDSIPGGGYYCQIAPRATWSTSLSTEHLAAGVDTYLRNYTAVSGRITAVDSINPVKTTVSGRIATVALVTNTGRYELSGDRIRFVLRPPNGEILRSTMFSLNATQNSDAGASRYDISGSGHGHGVGMCQWGAIGRARAGHDFRKILAVYFPGTEIQAVGN